MRKYLAVVFYQCGMDKKVRIHNLSEDEFNRVSHHFRREQVGNTTLYIAERLEQGLKLCCGRVAKNRIIVFECIPERVQSDFSLVERRARELGWFRDECAYTKCTYCFCAPF